MKKIRPIKLNKIIQTLLRIFQLLLFCPFWTPDIKIFITQPSKIKSEPLGIKRWISHFGNRRHRKVPQATSIFLNNTQHFFTKTQQNFSTHHVSSKNVEIGPDSNKSTLKPLYKFIDLPESPDIFWLALWKSTHRFMKLVNSQNSTFLDIFQHVKFCREMSHSLINPMKKGDEIENFKISQMFCNML